ncbi:DUF488 domain-containing protein [Parachlamydia sp. AcF125]|uniref:DUF488 domain-containing protein n=1 Tax=Parachlamydia sp. AcF125 TaxID=2795736 RepID=UPI001BCA4377|nr:DUF488 domain-containing protein [Parachlamydia sp. AcF125]MBS4168451.1 hypothetical protein [Parachlamydia sp. AcF125]
MKIKLKRVYDPVSPQDGVRVLVERLWPRGIKKENLKYDLWLKEIAPSPDLRKWFAHDPAKWGAFQEKYREELDKNPAAIQKIKNLNSKMITLLYSSKDTEHNNAVCLKNYLENKLK